MIFFSADPHFSRDNILDSARRPFADVAEMDAALLAGYRRRLTDADTLYLLGDLAHKTTEAETARAYFDQIPGRKVLIRGNHDGPAVCGLPWDAVHDYLELTIGGTMLVLSHYPMLTWNGARTGALHLFGHVHSNWPGSNRSVNVGVDHWGWAPATLDEILTRAATLPPPPFWDAVEPDQA